MILIVTTKESKEDLKIQINNYLKEMFNLPPVDIRFATVVKVKQYGVSRILPKYSLIITDYYAWSEKMVFISNLDYREIGEEIAGKMIKVSGEWTDSLSVAKQWIQEFEQNPGYLSMDLETDNLTLPAFQNVNMIGLGYSTTVAKAIVFTTPEIQQFVFNWLVTTKTQIFVAHNGAFDWRFIKYHTKQLPVNPIEDTQLLAQVYHNDTDSKKRKVGLKHLAKKVYSDWASAKETFELYSDHTGYKNDLLQYRGDTQDIEKYNLSLIYYLLIDVTATTFLHKKYTAIEEPNHTELIMPTSEPKDNTENFNRRDYYEYILKPALPMVIEMMDSGQAIDLEQVNNLKNKVEQIKEDRIKQIQQIPIVQEFQKIVDQKRIDKFLEPVYEKLAFPEFTPYKNNIEMRTFVVAYHYPEFFKLNSIEDIDLTKHKVTLKNLKEMEHEIAEILLNKDFNNEKVQEAMKQYAWYKASTKNIQQNRIDKIQHPEKYITIGFNPYNYPQLKEMWQYFGLESDETSVDTGEMSFNKGVLEQLAETTQGDIKKVLDLYLDIAQGKNLLTQYIPKYLGSTINGRVYGVLKLAGTLSFRLSGGNGKQKEEELRHKTGINLVTGPSSKSAYAEAVKKLFIAEKGKILYTIDYNGLENHISAILTKDPTAIDILNGKYEDMHTLHSTYFFTEKIEKEFGMDLSKITPEIVSQLFHDKRFKPIRNSSKGVTFGLAYGAFPKKIAKQLKCSIEEATKIFERYHNELYKYVTKYREEYVLPSSKQQKYIHLNWGARLYTSNPEEMIRSVNNATFQSYSTLTQIAGVKFRELIIKEKRMSSVKLVNIIHDALYLEIDDDLETIEWVNTNLPKIMTKDFLKEQIVKLKAEGDIGYNLYDTITLPNNANQTEIREAREKIRNK